MRTKCTVRIACAQINCTVGDMAGNEQKILQYACLARDRKADIVLFPELALTGYPPEDLLLKPSFVNDNLKKIKELAAKINGITAVAGFVDRDGKKLYNAAAVIASGRIKAVYRKMQLPNYGVFDEKRYFAAGEKPLVFALGKCVFGLNICEDIWVDDGPVGRQVKRGAKCILNINASPYNAGKSAEREGIVRRQAKKYGVPVVYVNLIGGQDELVFDGHSLAVDAKGKVVARGIAFQEDLLCVDIDVAEYTRRPSRLLQVTKELPCKEGRVPSPPQEEAAGRVRTLGPEEEIYSALLLGLKDYVAKNGFKKVVVGVSGGVDSALVATLAADALGKENVTAIFMPSRYSSGESEADARLLSFNLGINFKCVSIEYIYKSYLLVLEPHFLGLPRDIAEENLQARIRGNILMAFSNKFSWLVLTTGNKSEMSTGYATLYGDMAGGLAVIKDVPKMLVYELCRYRNRISPVIPGRVLEREPTAELRPNQKDTDSLPPYEVLDKILKAYVEEDKHYSEVTGMGFDEETVRKVFCLVDRSEYKRRQSPPGIKITPKAFGRDRRMPVTNKYPECAGIFSRPAGGKQKHTK
jgi:NAD+ synthase (glutamine-hydrolysing)